MKNDTLKWLLALPLLCVLLLAGCRTTVHTHSPRRPVVVVKPKPKPVVVHHHHHHP